MLPNPKQLNDNDDNPILEAIRDANKAIAEAQRRVAVAVTMATPKSVRLVAGDSGDPLDDTGTNPFTGTAMMYPAYVDANGNEWHFFGKNVGVLTFGMSATNGKATAGGGAVVLDDAGMAIEDGEGDPNSIKWKNVSTDVIALIRGYTSGVIASSLLSSIAPASGSVDDAQTIVNAISRDLNSASITVKSVDSDKSYITMLAGQLDMSGVTRLLGAAKSSTSSGTLNDDVAMSFVPQTATGIIMVCQTGGVAGTENMIAFYNTSAPSLTPFVIGSNTVALNVELTTGTTNGTDVKFNVSAYNGSIYLKNRMGAANRIYQIQTFSIG